MVHPGLGPPIVSTAVVVPLLRQRPGVAACSPMRARGHLTEVADMSPVPVLTNRDKMSNNRMQGERDE